MKELYNHNKLNIELCEIINSSGDLINKWYSKGNPSIIDRRKKKLKNIYGCVYNLSGLGCELGFGLGTSMYALCDAYKDITFDALDFCDLFKKFIPYLKDICRINDIWIGDSQEIPKTDNHYDFINSCSFFEHLPEKVYWKTLSECHRILKPGGLLGVYLDTTHGKQHIRLRKPKHTRIELKSIGFKPITDYLFEK